jgi:hypothetical protein
MLRLDLGIFWRRLRGGMRVSVEVLMDADAGRYQDQVLV